MNAFLKEVAEDLLARLGDELQHTAIIFTNKRPVVFIKKHLAGLLHRPVWSPAFFTVQEFFSLSSEKPDAAPLRQFFLLHRLHNQLLGEEGLDAETMDEFYPLAEVILNDFSQIDFEMASPEAVYAGLFDIAQLQQRFPHLSTEQQQFMKQFWESFSGARQSAVQERFLRLWGRLPALYHRFREALAAENLSYMAGTYRELAEGGADRPDFYKRYRKLVFVGFNALNACEASLFRKWQDEDCALFYFDADTYYVEDELQEAGRFIRKNIRTYGLRSALGDFPSLIAQKAGPVTLIETTGKTAQAKVLAQLAEGWKERADKPDTVAVILADESLLIPVLQSLPDEGIPFNITMGYPATQSSLFGLVELWLQVQQTLYETKNHFVHYADVNAYLVHPLSSVPTAVRDTLQQQMLQSEWLQVPAGVLQALDSVYPDFFAPVIHPERIPGQLAALLDHVMLSRKETGTLSQMEATLLLALRKTLNPLQAGLNAYDRLSPFFVISLLRKVLRRVSAPIEGEPLHGVQIMGLLESRCLDFSEVCIVGANEGVLPSVSPPLTYIPDVLRRAHGLPVMENQDALSAYLIYRLIQRADKVTFIYNNQVDDTNTGEPSRFIRQLEFESNRAFLRSVQQQPVKSELASPGLVVEKTGKVWQQLSRYIDPHDPDRPRLSASAFTTYLQSPLLFFLKYVARIKEPPLLREEFEMNRLGTVVHRVMQLFYEQLKETAGDADISGKMILEKMPQLPGICRDALSEEIFGVTGALAEPNSMQRILLKIAHEYAAVFLNHDASHEAPFRIMELENDKDYTIDFPVSVNGEMKSVRLYGIIDRVDIKGQKIRIVDYKTGRDEVKFNGSDTLFAPASSKSNKAMLQTLFYTYVYEQVKGLIGVEPNLYIARKLRTEGPLFYAAGRSSMRAEGEALEEIKAGFVSFLRSTLEELFNRDIPFVHNPGADVYPGDPFSVFLSLPETEAL